MQSKVMRVLMAAFLFAGSAFASDQPVRVVLGLTPYSMYNVWVVAKERGIDKEFGLDFDIKDFAGTAQAAQASVRGDVAISSSCIAEHLTSIVGAKNIVHFSTVGYFKGFFYVGRESEITEWDKLVAEKGVAAAVDFRRNEFKGKTFCIIPQRRALILDTIAQVGLTESDIKFLQFADDQKAATAFLAGQGNFYIGSLPQQRMLVREDGFVNAGGSDILGPAGLWYDTMTCTKEWIAGNRETALRLLGVLYATVNEFDKDPASFSKIAAKNLTRVTGSDYSEEEYLEFQTKYDDFLSLEEARDGFYNPDSPEYWRVSVDYQIQLQIADGVLQPGVSPDYYYGDGETLFLELLKRPDLLKKIDARK